VKLITNDGNRHLFIASETCDVTESRGVHSIDRWQQMPPGKSWGSKKQKTEGKIA